MCYAVSLIDDCNELFRYRPSYNVSPGANLPVVRRADGADGEEGVVLQCMKWGLIPSFTKKTEKPDHYRMVIEATVVMLFLFNLSFAVKLSLVLGSGQIKVEQF